MHLTFADTSKHGSLASRLRRARLEQFIALLPTSGAVRILDIGGTVSFWETLSDGVPDRISITVLNQELETAVNLESQAVRSTSVTIRCVTGDARHLSEFGDGHFDYCFSNSVIEHVGTLADQQAMAKEVRRVAGGYFIQTPYRYFPLEPHFHIPLWAQMPVWLRTALHQKLNLGWMPAQPDYLTARSNVEQIRLLSIRELRYLFPDADLRLERLGGLVKSIVAVRHAVPGQREALAETFSVDVDKPSRLSLPGRAGARLWRRSS
jgi:hypothetical protein